MDSSVSLNSSKELASSLGLQHSSPLGGLASYRYDSESDRDVSSDSEFPLPPKPLQEKQIDQINYQDLRIDVLGSDHGPADLTALTKSPSWTDEVEKRANTKDNGLILTILKTGFWGFVGTFATLFGQSWTGEVRAAQKMIKNPSTKVVMAVKLFSELGVDFRTLMELSSEELNKLLDDRSRKSIDARSLSEQVEFEGEFSLQKIQAKRQKDLVKWINALKLFVNDEEIGFTAKQAVVAAAIDNLVAKASDKKNPLGEGEAYLINQTLSLAVGDGLIGNEDFSGLEIVDSKIKIDGDAQQISGKGEIKVRNESDIFEKNRFPSAFITAYAASIAADLQLKPPKASDTKEDLEAGLETFKKSLTDLENEISLKAYAFAMAHYTGSDAGDDSKIEDAAEVIKKAIWDALFENEDFSNKLSEAVEGDEGLLAQINDLRDFESVQKKAGDAFLQTFSSLSTSYDENYNRSHAETFLNLSREFWGAVPNDSKLHKELNEKGYSWRGLHIQILDFLEKADKETYTAVELQGAGFPEELLKRVQDADGTIHLKNLVAYFYEGTGDEMEQETKEDYAFKTTKTLVL